MSEENRAPDLFDEVVGVRQWSPYIGLSTVALSSYNGTWKPGVNTAQCPIHHTVTLVTRPTTASTHIPPEEGCTCGLYVYHDVSRFNTNGYYGPVSGVVRAWGKIAVAKDGFRAQYAEVVALAASNRGGLKPGDLDALAKKYDVPIVKFDELDIIKLEYGDPIPKELRPGITNQLVGAAKKSPVYSPAGAYKPGAAGAVVGSPNVINLHGKMYVEEDRPYRGAYLPALAFVIFWVAVMAEAMFHYL